MDDNERKSAKKRKKKRRAKSERGGGDGGVGSEKKSRRPKSEKGGDESKIKSKLERQREREKRLDDAKLESRREGVVERQDDIHMDAKQHGWGNNEDVESTDQNEKFQDQVDEPLKDYGKHEGEKSDVLVSMAVVDAKIENVVDAQIEKRLLEIQLQIERGKAGSSEIDERAAGH